MLRLSDHRSINKEPPSQEVCALVDLLETAHGYAIAGSIVPLKAACMASDLLDNSDTAQTRALIDRATEPVWSSAFPASLQRRSTLKQSAWH